MKKSRYLVFGILLCVSQSTYSSTPDEWCGPKKRVLFQNWTVNASIGFTSYFGDLSQYDLSPVNKMVFESKPAYGLKLTKYIKNIFGISGQVIYGGFQSDYKPQHTFQTKLLEYSVQAGLDIINLIFPRNTLKYGLEAYVGAGQFIFRTSVFTVNDGLQSPNTFSTGVPEFVYFFGGELYYTINNRFRVTVDLSIRQAQNDNIDKYLKNGDFDYYSLLNVGISYSLGKLFIPNKDESNFKLNKASPVWR